MQLSSQMSADEEPFVVTIQSSHCHTSLVQGSIVLDFRLPRSLHFEAPHFARLLHVSGLRQPVFVHSSFTKPQPFNHWEQRLFGISSSPNNQFVPITGNSIPATNSLTLFNVSGELFGPTLSDITIVFQVAPAAWAQKI